MNQSLVQITKLRIKYHKTTNLGKHNALRTVLRDKPSTNRNVWIAAKTEGCSQLKEKQIVLGESNVKANNFR